MSTIDARPSTLLLTVVLLQIRFLELLAARFTCSHPMDIRFEQGVQTEQLPESRAEYDPFPGNYSIQPGHHLCIEFKTREENGLIFLAGNIRYGDMVWAFLRNGHVIFARRCGYGRAFETAWGRVDDGKWHRLKYIHGIRGGTLLVDDRNPFRRYHMGPCADVTSLLFGGLSSHVYDIIGGMAGKASNHRFSGCLRNMRIDNRVPGIPPSYRVVSECPKS